MASISIDADHLLVDVQGSDKLWALKSRLSIPLEHVRGATADPGIGAEPKGLRGPGTHVRGVITAGTFHQDGLRVFWDVHNAAKAVVIELDDERYQRLVLEVDDPKGAVDLVEAAVAGHPGRN